jgi:hypothetical protein
LAAISRFARRKRRLFSRHFFARADRGNIALTFAITCVSAVRFIAAALDSSADRRIAPTAQTTFDLFYSASQVISAFNSIETSLSILACGAIPPHQ